MLDKLGIQIVRLELPFRLNHVNCLSAEGEEGWAIMDTGLNNKRTRVVWNDSLRHKDLAHIYVSHYHPDHFGCAGELQRLTGASVTMSIIDEKSGKTVWEPEFINTIKENYTKYGVPPNNAMNMTEDTESFVNYIRPYPHVTEYFEEGNSIKFGNYEYEIITTPGHADGLVVFFNEETSTLLSTDHILPDITPNVAYWFHGLKNPLQAYIHSLKKVKELDVGFVIPSHGKPFYDANKRIKEILLHHNERLEFVLKNVSDGDTAYQMSKKLFPLDLDAHEKRFALGETIAHLDYLVSNGELKKERKDNIWHYYLS